MERHNPTFFDKTSSYQREDTRVQPSSSLAGQRPYTPEAYHVAYEHHPYPIDLRQAEEFPLSVACHQGQPHYIPEGPPIDPSSWGLPYSQLDRSSGVTQRDQHPPFYPMPALVRNDYPPATSPFSLQDIYSSHQPAVADHVEPRAPPSSRPRSARYSPLHDGRSANNGGGERAHNGHPPYRCRWDVGQVKCDSAITGNRRSIEKHLRDCHRVERDLGEVRCLWEGCRKREPMKRENLARHLMTHMNIHCVCSHCGREFSRSDAVQRHLDHVYRDRGLAR